MEEYCNSGLGKPVKQQSLILLTTKLTCSYFSSQLLRDGRRAQYQWQFMHVCGVADKLWRMKQMF